EAAAAAAPEGWPRWSCLCYLADALRVCGCPDASLPFYEQVATLARTAAEAQGENGRQAWVDVSWITGLLTELEAAVRTGNRARATQLEQTILQRLASEAAERASLERYVRALMAALDQPAASPRVSTLDPFSLERSSPEPNTDGV